MNNEGAEALRKLRQPQATIAARIGCSRQHVFNWVHGVALPDGVNRAKLEDAFGIFWRLWDRPVAGAAPRIPKKAARKSTEAA